jgi:heme a synthase
VATSLEVPATDRPSTWITARNLRIAAAFSLGLLWLVVTTGGLVRLTSSGLGCPHWPTCDSNSLLPADSSHALIEFSNRVISGLAMLASVGIALLARRLRGMDAVSTALVVAAAGTVLQVPLGAVTVAFDLNPFLVMSHFLLAMLVLTFATWGTVQLWREGHEAAITDRRLGWLSWATVAAGLALVTSGTFVTAAGPHPGSTSTPIQRIGNFYDATWVHVRVATTFAVLLVALAVWLWRRPAPRAARLLAAAALLLMAAQAGVGEYQYRNGLPWQVIAVHVALAATLLIAVVAIATFASPAPAGRQRSA